MSQKQQFNDYIAIGFNEWLTQPTRRRLTDIREKVRDNFDSKL